MMKTVAGATAGMMLSLVLFAGMAGAHEQLSCAPRDSGITVDLSAIDQHVFVTEDAGVYQDTNTMTGLQRHGGRCDGQVYQADTQLL